MAIFRGTSLNKSVYISEIGVFAHESEWQQLDKETIQVRDPLYHQKFSAYKYQLVVDGRTAVFAACEFSNGVMAIYEL